MKTQITKYNSSNPLGWILKNVGIALNALLKRSKVLLNVLIKCLFSSTKLPALCTFNDPSVLLNIHNWCYRRFFCFSPMPPADHCPPPPSPRHWKGYKRSAKYFALLLLCLTPRRMVSGHHSSSMLVGNNGVIQTECLLLWTLCLGWLFISVSFLVYECLPASIATGKKKLDSVL